MSVDTSIRTEATSHDHHDEPAFELWLGVMLVSLVPAALTVLLPATLFAPAVGASATLFAASLVLLRLRSRRRVREQARAAERARSGAKRRPSLRLEAVDS